MGFWWTVLATIVAAGILGVVAWTYNRTTLWYRLQIYQRYKLPTTREQYLESRNAMSHRSISESLRRLRQTRQGRLLIWFLTRERTFDNYMKVATLIEREGVPYER